MTSVERIASRELLGNLLQNYLYELSFVYGDDMDENGRYAYAYTDSYFANDPSRIALGFWNGDRLTGFVLINDHSCLGQAIDHAVAECTVFPKYRRMGCGSAAMAEVFRRYPGRWEIKYSLRNPGAGRFWTRVTQAYGPQVTALEDDERVLRFTV